MQPPYLNIIMQIKLLTKLDQQLLLNLHVLAVRVPKMQSTS